MELPSNLKTFAHVGQADMGRGGWVAGCSWGALLRGRVEASPGESSTRENTEHFALPASSLGLADDPSRESKQPAIATAARWRVNQP